MFHDYETSITGLNTGRYYLSKYAHFALRVGIVVATPPPPSWRPAMIALINHQRMVSKQHGRNPAITLSPIKPVRKIKGRLTHGGRSAAPDHDYGPSRKGGGKLDPIASMS